MDRGSPRPPLRVLSRCGRPLTLDDLPPPHTRRWVVRRKAEVVGAVRDGLLSLDDACARYTLSVDEFVSWQRLLAAHGLPGLRTTKVQNYRGGPDSMDAQNRSYDQSG